jgi:SAM-dependent methyltransferase
MQAQLRADTMPAVEQPWGYLKRLRFFEKHIARFGQGAAVLDVGCGNGSYVAIPLAARGYQVTGVDTHEASIQRGRELSSAVRFICGTVADVSGEFDAVIVSEVLEHVPDPAGLLQQCAQRTKPEGVLLVTLPNGYGEFEWDSTVFYGLRLDRLVDRFRRHRNGISSSECKDGHIHFFRLKQLRQMFAAAGLAEIEAVPGPLACGPFAVYGLNVLPYQVTQWNARITDRLPLQCASSWYFALHKRNDGRGAAA